MAAAGWPQAVRWTGGFCCGFTPLSVFCCLSGVKLQRGGNSLSRGVQWSSGTLWCPPDQLRDPPCPSSMSWVILSGVHGCGFYLTRFLFLQSISVALLLLQRQACWWRLLQDVTHRPLFFFCTCVRVWTCACVNLWTCVCACSGTLNLQHQLFRPLQWTSLYVFLSILIYIYIFTLLWLSIDRQKCVNLLQFYCAQRNNCVLFCGLSTKEKGNKEVFISIWFDLFCTSAGAQVHNHQFMIKLT